MAGGIFGWDLLYSSVEKDINTSQDILVCLAHLVLISNGFKCMGLGTSNIVDGTRQKETLPRGWNKDYSLRYFYQGQIYNFKATSLDGGVMFNLQKSGVRTESLVQFKSSAVIKKCGSLEEIVPDYSNIADIIKKQLFEKVVDFRKHKEVITQTLDTDCWLFSTPSYKPLGGEVKVLFTQNTTQFNL